MIPRSPCLQAVTSLLAIALVPALGSAAEPTLSEERAFQAAVARVAPAVVRIEPLAVSAVAASGELRPGEGPSTGIVVAPERVLTTDFAIPADVEESLVVLADGGRRVARVLGRDRSRGLVLVAVTDLPATPPLEPAARADLAPGQWAIAVGRGWTATSPSVAVGIVSATNRAWGKAVQTDAAVSPMNYGGPLVDLDGRVIGVLAPLPADTAGLTEGTELYDAGIGFAVPLEDVLAVLPRLERGETLAPGMLGIAYRSQDPINGQPIVGSVRPGSPAAAAGLEPGDRLVSIDDRPITRIADAKHAVAPRYAGDRISITLSRETAGETPKELTVEATLVDRLPPWRRAVIGVVPVDGPTPEPGGIELDWIWPGSPADRAGLEPGDIVTAVALEDGPATPTHAPDDLAGMLAGLLPGGKISMTFRRAGRETSVGIETTTPPADLPVAGLARPARGIDPLAGPLRAAPVVKLQAAEAAEPTLAVIPAGTSPMGVLIWLGPPQGPIAEAEARAWQQAAAESGVAVLVPGSADPATWSRGDIDPVLRSLAALHGRRPVDPRRVGVAGSGAGAAFAWLVAERLGTGARGVALVGGGLPRLATVADATPDRDWWLLLGPGGDEATRQRIEADRDRLAAAGYAVGLLPAEPFGDIPSDRLCRWVSLLGML